MKITSAKFIKSVTGTDKIFEDGIPQVAFIGRSNAGKSSVINSLVGQNQLARTSISPGRTKELNFFLINNSLYLVDLPGYGFAKLPRRDRERIEKMINWYFFESPYEQKAVAVIIDANVGLTGNDLEMLMSLEKQGKHIIIVANKVDKIKKSQYAAQLQEIKGRAGDSKVIPYSAHKGTGLQELINEIVRR